MECRELVAENLARRATLHAGCNPVRVERREDGALDFTWKDGNSAEHTMAVDQVMMATGRHPKTQQLGLEVRARGSTACHARRGRWQRLRQPTVCAGCGVITDR